MSNFFDVLKDFDKTPPAEIKWYCYHSETGEVQGFNTSPRDHGCIEVSKEDINKINWRVKDGELVPRSREIGGKRLREDPLGEYLTYKNWPWTDVLTVIPGGRDDLSYLDLYDSYTGKLDED